MSYKEETPTILTTSVSEVYQKSDLIGGIFIPLEKSNNNLPKILSQKKPEEIPLDILTSKKSNWHISISPDGENVLIFDHEKLEFKIIPEKIINDSYEKESYDVRSVFKNEESKKDYPKWTIAISNSITNTLNEKEVLVAISRVTKSDTTSPGKKNLNNENLTSTNSNEFEEKEPEPVEIVTTDTTANEGNTVIYKIKLNQKSKPERICSDLPGGIVIFVHNDKKNYIYCLIFNVKGIFRKKFTHDLSGKRMKQFYYPKRLQDDLNTLYKRKSCITRLFNSIFDHYFFIEQYKGGTQVLQLYDLRTMEMKQFFNLHVRKSHVRKSLRKFGTPIFARSNDEKIIAFSFGFGKLFLFLVENGLEIASEDFGKGVKILFCDFINNDKTIIVIVQKSESECQILYWNLFSTSNHVKSGRKVNFVTDEENISSIARIPGKLITVDTYGNISSVFDRLINNCDPEEEGKEIHSIVIHNDNSKLVESPRKMSCSKSKNEHTIYSLYSQNKTKPLVSKEPWVIDVYDRTSVFLDKEETTQLFIGRSTIQVWRKIAGNKKVELEYIWANNVKANREETCALKVDELYIGDRSFYIKVRWDELKDNEFFEVKWPYSDNHVTPIIHACDAFEHLNYRRNKLAGNKKQHVFEDMKDRISYIIWRFIKNKPNIWRLMDVRFDIMAKVIIGGSNTLIKYILFGDGKDKNWNLHIPKINRWENEDEKKFKIETIEEKGETKIKNLSDLQIATRLCRGGLEGDTRSLIVAYLLEYYAENLLKHKHIGWLSTVSEALPDFYRYNLTSYAKGLFFKRCISGIKISKMIEYEDIIPKEIEVIVKASQEFIAFNPNTKLISTKDETQKSISLRFKELNVKIFSNTENLSPTVKIIPLRNFTVRKREKLKHKAFLLKVFQYVFIPRRYLSDIKLSSPLVQIVRNEKNEDDIFDNPTMAAAINYKWGPTRNYFLGNFFRYILFAACFAALVGCYLGHVEATGHLYNLLVFLFILFYYSGVYLFLVECIQLRHHTTSNITAGLSFTMLLLWFDFILHLRLFLEPALYIYIIVNIIKKTYLFVVFMLLVVLAFSHVFLLLLQHTDFSDLDDITSKKSSYTIQNSAGDVIGTSLQDFDRKQDNPSKDFGTSFLSTYAWLRGSFPQEAIWDFWAVEALTLIGSLVLITVIQNMFIAFLSSAHAEAFEKGRAALLYYRAKLISDYEMIDEIYFSPPPSDPKYIYYLDELKSYDTWEKLVKTYENKLYDGLEKIMDETELSFKEKNNENSFLNYNKPDYDDDNSSNEESTGDDY
ncbi:12529_t:CDS:10 [Rhizophagus irregularis]|nr:12529_t:CDS:10 [Rhizophagus irregularis]